MENAAAWLEHHLAISGVSVVAVTNTAWLHAVWRQEAVSLKGSKTDYLFMPTEIAEQLPQPPQQPSEAHLLEVLGHILAVYEAKTSRHVEGKLLGLNTCLYNVGFIGMRICLWYRVYTHGLVLQREV